MPRLMATLSSTSVWAAARAESVKTALVNRYKIPESRIVAEGEGIGHMFAEDSWNRVSICTIED